MILPLRHLHRATFTCLAIILPVIFVSGLVARRAPSALAESAPASPAGEVVLDSMQLWRAHSIRTIVYKAPGQTSLSVRLSHADVGAPDVLVYWSDSKKMTNISDAHLLGRFDSENVYQLPTGARGGSLVLYSLGHREMIDFAILDPAQ